MELGNKRLGQPSEETKRTTIILEKPERDFIDHLLNEGKETGIKPLISKMLDIYRNLMVSDWIFPGEYYCGISRVAFVNIELINVLIQNLPKEKWFDIGKKLGEILKISMDATIGVDTFKQENWIAVFERLCVQGFGFFHLKDKYLLLKNPFLNETTIWEGILEGLFGVKVATKNSIPPFVFEISRSA